MIKVLPKAKEIHIKKGNFYLTYNTDIVLGDGYETDDLFAVNLLKETIHSVTDMNLKIRRAVTERPYILLCVKAASDSKAEGYEIHIEENHITVMGEDKAGLFYGIQSLRQIIATNGACIECADIVDFPSLANRGFYHDATRSRIQTLDSYKKLADTCAYFKINQLQLYVEHTFMFEKFTEVWRDDTPLTAQDILELDAYCKKLHIDLVPSIATFGHLYKVLRTKSFDDLNELEGMREDPFYFDQRMQHHTLNITDDRTFDFVTKMLDEFMPLFTSGYFNICADETFDLGKGRSKETADKIGVNRMYVDFVNRLAKYCIEKGKIPMFWGDIIVGCPEFAKDLPEEIICLNWGYGDNEREDNTRKLYEQGMKQYLCPGVHGWRHSINRLDAAYKNISLMCGYAQKYHAIGILNTDWGDYGHFQDPAFSVPGLIYGADFSWDTVREEQEVDRDIAEIAYGDATGTLVATMKKLAMCERVTWERFVQFKEYTGYGMEKDKLKEFLKTQMQLANNADDVKKANETMDSCVKELYRLQLNVNCEGKTLIRRLAVFARGQYLMHESMRLAGYRFSDKALYEDYKKDCYSCAESLEYWMAEYKEIWRESSRESELKHNEAVFYWFADYLRD